MTSSFIPTAPSTSSLIDLKLTAFRRREETERVGDIGADLVGVNRCSWPRFDFLLPETPLPNLVVSTKRCPSSADILLGLQLSLALTLDATELVRRILGAPSSSLQAVEGTVDALPLVVEDHRKFCREEEAEETELLELCEGECLIGGEVGEVGEELVDSGVL